MRTRQLVARILPPDEWPKIAATGMRLPLAQGAAHQGDVIVVERGHQIVGCWALLTLFHAEGLWIDPADQKTGAVGRRLFAAMREMAQRRGAKAAWVNAVDPAIARLALNHGAQFVPGTHFVFPLED